MSVKQQQQQQQQPSRLVLQLCFAILLLLESMSPPKPSESPEGKFLPHFDIKKSEKKNCKKRKNHTEATRKQKNPGRRSRAEQSIAAQRCSDAASERSEAQAGFRHMALDARETKTTRRDPTRPNHGSSPTWQLRTNRITKDFFFSVLFRPPLYLRGGYFKRI